MKIIILCLTTVFCLLCFMQEAGFALYCESRQGSVMSKQCPTGGKEAEELYQLGRQYRHGHGVPCDKKKAEELFEQALAMGSAKAALQIGQMYMWDFSPYYPSAKRKKYMIAMYVQAAKMGCPEAYLMLSECYEKGWGVRTDEKKSLDMLEKAAKMGSPKALEFYGVYVVKRDLFEEGRKLLDWSIEMGNGDAGVGIATIYQYQIIKSNAPGHEDAESNIDTIRHNQEMVTGLIDALRAGAKLGSKACIMQLTLIYLGGTFGQTKDKDYANRLDDLYESIDDFYPPEPIPDFDERFPPKPILPFRE